MEASINSSVLTNLPTTNLLLHGFKSNGFSKPSSTFVCTKKHCTNLIRNKRKTATISAINDAVASSAMADPIAQVEITWQILVGVIAGVTPFVVAGVEFSKRIIAQRRCEVCGGSGLVFRNKDYFKCPGCGGFLPWQSWRRFFSG